MLKHTPVPSPDASPDIFSGLSDAPAPGLLLSSSQGPKATHIFSVDSTASVTPYRVAQGLTFATFSGSQEPPSCAAHFFSGGAAEPLLCGCVGGKRQTSTPYFNKSSAAQSYAINPTRAAFGSWWHPSSGGTNKSSRAKGVHFYSLQSRPRTPLSGWASKRFK